RAVPGSREPGNLAKPLIKTVEPYPVFPYRSTERESELVLFQVFCTQGKEAACIQIAVAQKFVSFAMKVVAAALSRDIYRGRVWSLVRHEKALLDLELINCGDGDIQ